MALSADNSNFITRGKSRCGTILDLRKELELELAEWNLTGMFDALGDADIQAGGFPSMVKGDVVGYINAIKAVLVALGTADLNGDPVHNDVSSQAANLIKMLRK